ncbi:NAD(P)/FAD-dependent oxidoreductase [Candidatus Woesearchaeota archaeon]|nr:NAD(P)/FAD-dependent oxidoreductase [Candidatus Woesearchaeota archaeon]
MPISIIGAGPAGLYTAYLLAKQGKKVNVFEEHKKIGLPVQCTGITTLHLKDLVEIKKEFLINKVNTARIYSNNNSIDFKLKKENIVLDRKKFDIYLAKKAKGAGAKIFLSHKFIKKEKDNIIIKDIKKNKSKKIKNEILIGADGPSSKVSELINKKNKNFWIGIQARVKIKTDKNVFEAHLGSISPKFFAWLVPENADTARIGLATHKNAKFYLDKFLKLKNIKQKDIIEHQAGIIPVYNPKLKIRNKSNNIFLVGDAAAQVKATTGGGLIPSLLSSKALVNSIINKKIYENELKKTVGKDLFIALKIREILNTFSDKDYSYLLELFKNKKIKEIIEEHDREFPSKFIIKLLTAEPRFFYFSKKLFLIKSFLK